MFTVPEEAHHKIAPVRSPGVTPETGAVDLDRSAVVAVFIQYATAQENASIVAQPAVELRQSVLRMNIARLIDGAALAGGDQDVPVSGEDLRARQARPFAELQHSQERVVAGRFRTVAGRKLKVVGFGPNWE